MKRNNQKRRKKLVKVSQKDDGQLQMATGARGGNVVVQFGKPIAWMSMSPDDATLLIDNLKQARTKAIVQVIRGDG